MNKKIVIGIVVTIIVIVLAVAGGVIAYRMTRDTSKPEDVLIKYVGYVNEQNYEEMYKLLTNDSKEQISKEDFITRNKNIYEGIDMTDMKIEITNVTEENSKTYVISYNQSMNSEAGKIEFENTANVIKDYKEDFNEALMEQENILKKISKLKATLYEKNNSFKLSDGRTIQSAIVDNTYLRKLKSFYDDLLKCKSAKRRVTEVNNSYFDCVDVNYNADEIREKSKTLEKQIQRTDFEISKLNSIEFEISL